MTRLLASSLLVVSLMSLGACGGARTTNTVTTTTTGQELTDLKAALDAGAITPKEYDKKHKEILRKKG